MTPDQGDRGDLGARVREVLAEAVCECGHPVLPLHLARGCAWRSFCGCKRTAHEALAPAVVTLMTEHAAKVAGEVEASVWEWFGGWFGGTEDWRGAGEGRILRARFARLAALRAGGEG